MSVNLEDDENTVVDLSLGPCEDEGVNIEMLVGENILTKDGKLIQVSCYFKNKSIIIYFFSALWAPATDLIDKLKTLYSENLKRNTKMEIIFVSSDNDEKAFKEYFAEQGPWCALPYKSAICDELRWMYDITCLPQIIVIRTDGTVITRKGKNELERLGNNVIVSWTAFIQQ